MRAQWLAGGGWLENPRDSVACYFLRDITLLANPCALPGLQISGALQRFAAGDLSADALLAFFSNIGVEVRLLLAFGSALLAPTLMQLVGGLLGRDGSLSVHLYSLLSEVRAR